jgi:hypothetical protein
LRVPCHTWKQKHRRSLIHLLTLHQRSPVPSILCFSSSAKMTRWTPPASVILCLCVLLGVPGGLELLPESTPVCAAEAHAPVTHSFPRGEGLLHAREVFAVAPYRVTHTLLSGERYSSFIEDEPWHVASPYGEAMRGFRLPSSLALCQPFQPLSGRSSLSG